jgi:hypothetical protein
VTARYGGKVQVQEVPSQSSFYSASDCLHWAGRRRRPTWKSLAQWRKETVSRCLPINCGDQGRRGIVKREKFSCHE